MGQPIQVFAYTGTETYLLTCMRYIELNPVRATMVEAPAHYLGQAIEPTPSDKRRRF